jgi:CheY-like chemotaxis protein
VARILVIDDEPMIRTVLRYELEPAGHDVLLAEDGLRGVAFARRQKPDVIILDLMMPILDGYSVLEMLRKVACVAVTSGVVGAFWLARRGLPARVQCLLGPSLGSRAMWR